MGQLSVRLKLYLMLGCAVLALLAVGVCGWWGIQRVGESLHAVGSRSLPAVTALSAMHGARLEAAKAMQDGVAFRPSQYDDTPLKDDLIEEMHALFGEILEQSKAAGLEGQHAFGIYEALPKTAEEEALWAAVKPVWNDYQDIDQQQMELTATVYHSTDWDSLISTYSVFAANTVQWSAVVDQLTPILKQLRALNVSAAVAVQQEGQSTVSDMQMVMQVAISALLLAVGALGTLVARSIIQPLTAIRAVISEVSASNDFTLRAEVKGRDEVAQTAAAFNLLLETIRESLQEVVNTTATVSSSAELTSSVSREIEESALQQRESAMVMAAAAEQMTVSIGHITLNTERAAAQAFDASSGAKEGAENVGNTAMEMDLLAKEISSAGQSVVGLGRESERISEVVNVIREVAEQTNLLALNAAIEAARAGDQGRGFAVVADEVRKLAERTTHSAKEISIVVASMQESSRAAVRWVEAVILHAEAGKALSDSAAFQIGRVRERVGQANESVSDVATSLSEQERAAQDIARRVQAIAIMSTTACDTGGRAAKVSSDLENAARDLRRSVGRFRV